MIFGGGAARARGFCGTRVWLRLTGCDRVVLAVADDGDGKHVRSLYGRFGWRVVAHEGKAWIMPEL